MAPIARRTFDLLKDEHVLRVGRSGDTTYTAAAGRAEQFVTAAYLDICRLWHHSELDATATSITLSTSAPSVSLSTITDLDIVVGFVIRAVVGGAAIKGLRKTNDLAGLFAKQRETQPAQPKEYGRFGVSLYFDTKPDAAYPTTLYYYKTATAPDFGTGGGAVASALRRVWDEHILQYSVALSQGALWVPQHIPAGYQFFQEWLRGAGETPLATGLFAERPRDPAPLGGAVG